MEDKIKDEICKRYKGESIGIETLAKEYHVGKIKIKAILSENGIKLKKKGNQELKLLYKVDDYHTKKYIPRNGYHFIVYDPNTDFQSKDIDNAGGVLTTYIETQYKVATPTLYDRRMYYMTTGNYWWEQWLEVKEVENHNVKKCPYCDWETTDVDNRTGAFIVHLERAHGLTKQEYIEKHPEDKQYITCVVNVKNIAFETDENKFVLCPICGKKLKHLNAKHIFTHNMTPEDFKMKYGWNGIVSNEYRIFLADRMDTINQIIGEKYPDGVKHSKCEEEIKNFLESNGIKCKSTRNILSGGKEIDIYIPDKKIGIEYNGLFYHCEHDEIKRGQIIHKCGPKYHLGKLEECNEKGISLIQIFEDEYLNNKELVLKKILHIVGYNKCTDRIYGRKCTIKEISKHEAKFFLNTHHIQGETSCTLAIGAYYNERLVGVMSFLDEKDGNWNLVRYASDTNTICIGVAGKLFSFFLKNYPYNKIKTFADRRWTLNSSNNLYTKLGFKLDKIVPPSYSYVNFSVSRNRIHKFSLRKSALVKMEPSFSMDMTETEMTNKLGYHKIWDCGLYRYVYERKNV